MDYPISVPGVGLVDGKFVDEDQVTGTPGSLIPAAWGNAVTDELLNILARSGIVPDEAAFDQLAKAIFDSPTFGANAKGTTAPQFDNDTSLVTTAFLRKAGMQASGVQAIEANTTLTPADMGTMKMCQAAGGFTVTLPLAAAVPIGTRIEIYCAAPNVTIARQGGEAIHVTYASGGAVASLVMGVGDKLTVVANSAAGGWLVDGAAQLFASSKFACSLSSSGYQKLPSGMIIQWGFITCSASGPVTWTYPIAFPNQVLTVGPLGVAAAIAQYANIGAAGAASCPVSAWDYTGARTANNVFMVAIGK